MKRLLIISATALLCILLIIEFIVPQIAKQYIQKHSYELIGRKIDIGSLGINIFTGNVCIEDFTLYEANDSDNFIAFHTLEVNISLTSLIQKKIDIESLTLSNARYNITQNGTQFNFSDIIEHFAADSTKDVAPADTSAANWDIIINNISIEHNLLHYHDNSIGSEWIMHDLSLAIPTIDLSNPNAQMGLNLNFAEGGKLSTNVSVEPTDSTYNLYLDIDRFSLTPLLPYLKQTINIESIEGNLTTKLNIKGSMQHVINFDIMGTLAIDSFRILSPDSVNIISFDSLYNEIKSFNLSKKNIAFGRVYTSGLSSQFEIFNDKENTITRLLAPIITSDSLISDTTSITESAQTNADTDTISGMPRICIDNLSIVNSSAQFTDHSLPQVFDYNISNIEVNTQNFIMDGNDNDVHITATLQNAGNLDLRWRGGINDICNQNISIALNNIDLEHFSPYSLYMFGSPITSGKLTISSQNIIKSGKLDGTNHIGIFNPEIGDKDRSIKPQTKAPLKLALYILTDKDNNISLDMPIKGDINSPEFSYGKIILNTFCNLLVKVATSPLSAFKSDDTKAEFVEVEPYKTSFTDAQLASFTSMSEVLAKKPNMQLSLVQEIDKTKALAACCLLHLKKQLYIQQNNIDAAHINDIIVEERALKISDSDKTLNAFANKKIEETNTSVEQDAEIAQKAIALYANTLEATISQNAEARNAKLLEYLKRNNIEIPTITTEYITIDKGASTQYHAHWSMK